MTRTPSTISVHTVHTRRNKRLVCCIGVGFVGLALWSGCSVENNYELLSKFFDGVPDPNAPDKYDGRAISQSSTYTEHEPYIQDNCFECHTNPSEMLLSKDDSSMCMKCHDEIAVRYAYMHGAVTGEACLMCHNPHISALPNLLRDDGVSMCIQCHELEDRRPIEAHGDNERRCIDCHSGHGGDAPFFLHTNPISEEDTEAKEIPAEESDSEGSLSVPSEGIDDH